MKLLMSRAASCSSTSLNDVMNHRQISTSVSTNYKRNSVKNDPTCFQVKHHSEACTGAIMEKTDQI